MINTPPIQERGKTARTPLAKGNEALRQGNFAQAISHYAQVIVQQPGLAKSISANLSLARQKYRTSRQANAKTSVAVCGWELAHNAAGRAYTLATIYETFAHVEIIGSLFPSFGREIWEPIRDTAIAKHTFIVEDECKFIEQAIQLVVEHPYDIVHLSKPRAPNIFFGILYKLLWGAKVLMDIDDEELAFVGSETPVSIDDYIQQHGKLPELKNLAGKDWTRLAVGLAKEFDGLTVCNAVLQQRYGGEIIRHARDEKLFKPSPELKRQSREKYGIPQDVKVVLFFGTPREHKGLIETAHAIAALKRPDLIYCIVGSFSDESLKQRLLEVKGCNYKFLPNQPISKTPEILSIADCCVLLQNTNSTAAQFQTPAKLSDALFMSIPVILTKTKSNTELTGLSGIKFIEHESILDQLAAYIHAAIPQVHSYVNKSAELIRKFSLHSNAAQLKSAVFWRNCETATSRNIEMLLSNAKLPVLALRKPKKPHLLSPPKPKDIRKLPITALVITWDVGHNPLGRSYMVAEALQRVVRNVVLVGFQFPRYGNDIWEPVRDGSLPVIRLPVSDLPDFITLQQRLGERMKADVVIACKPRLPSLQLGLQVRQHFGCPLIVDIDDHELSFFKSQTELSLNDLADLPDGACAGETEPYAERWTRLAEHLCLHADACIVSNVALQRRFGGVIVPHARDERVFDPEQFDQRQIRSRHGVPVDAKVMLFFGTPRHHKGINVLAEATARIEDPNFKLVVVGSSTDRSVTAKLDALAPGRIIHLPNQPFDSIPEVLRMADIVCLPQDLENAISSYQLPAKAIDAIAMSVPLLVSRTEPLMQLVSDGVAEALDADSLVDHIRRVVYGPPRTAEAVQAVRQRFLARYSYAAIAEQMGRLISQTLAERPGTKRHWSGLPDLMAQQRRLLGAQPAAAPVRAPGIDIVVFWKQNDSCLYGRRSDMVIKYLASRHDVRRVLVIDAPISEFDLIKFSKARGAITQERHIYVKTYEKAYGAMDVGKIAYDVFIIPQGVYDLADLAGHDQADRAPNGKPRIFPDYAAFLRRAFAREGIDPTQAVFWLYPKNHLGPRLIDTFKPRRVVVDVVDDHRAWPGIAPEERERLTANYRETLARADLAFANCQPVVDSMREFHPAIRLVPNGCDERPQAVSPPASSAAVAPRKAIVFVGNLEKKIDIPLLDKLALRFAECDIVLIGSTHANPQVLELKRHANIRFLGVVPYAEIGSWLARADVGIIPHLNFDLTQSMNPLKLYVYLSWFVPVVSTEVYNIDTSTSFVRVAAGHDTFLSHVAQTLAAPRLDRQAVQAYIQANSWRARFETHIDALHQPLIAA